MSTLINILIIFFIFLISYQLILAYIHGGNSYINLIEGMETKKVSNSNSNSNSDSKIKIKPTSTTDTDNNKHYQPYNASDPNNALILEQQNAGNIAYLKQRMDSIQDLNKEVKDISGNVVDLQNQVHQLIAAQQQYTTRMTGGKVPHITGVLPKK